MLVAKNDLDFVINKLKASPFLAVDTETTGLKAYKHDRLFCIVIADKWDAYYFNFQPYEHFTEEELEDKWLGDAEKARLNELFGDKSKTWYIHNAKFDLAMLANENLFISGRIWCTMAIGRILRNDLMSYSLDQLTSRWLTGANKSDAVKEYIDTHKLYETKTIPGRKRVDKIFYYQKVPLAIMQPYAEQDVKITYQLGEFEREKLNVLVTEIETLGLKVPTVKKVTENESKLTRTIFAMEQRGIQIDRQFCREALTFEQDRIEKANASFKDISGEEFVDSGKALAEVFKKFDIKLPKTDKGSPKVSDDVISGIDHPLAKIIQEHRDASKRANTYYGNFLDLSDDYGVIHPNFMQSGTKTGRMSCTDPNLQNLTKESLADTNPYKVRAAFIPRKGYCFFAPDYEQMEYRMMLDYAGEKNLIDAVLGGLDIHQATGNMVGISRTQAKTLNFALLYGAGVEKLSIMLKVTQPEAKDLKATYFAKLPKVASFSSRVIQAARDRGFVTNWYGRRCNFEQRDFAYSAPNHLIQGGCADVVKVAMNECRELLKNSRSYMVLNIHDELVFELHEHDLNLATKIQEIMNNSYPHKYLPMATSPSYSWTNLANKIDGLPKLP
jgi:DNA polymerase-1